MHSATADWARFEALFQLIAFLVSDIPRWQTWHTTGNQIVCERDLVGVATMYVCAKRVEGYSRPGGFERLTGALLDRLTHHVHILEMNGDSFRLK